MPHQRADPANRALPGSSRWYRQPLLWLGLAIFAASMAGCLWIIRVSSRYADPPLPTQARSVMGVPATAQPRAERSGE